MRQAIIDVRDEALQLRRSLDWFVFPAAPTLKAPYRGFRWKPYGETLPPVEEMAAWEQWTAPGARIGTRTGAVSGIIVLDCDGPEAIEYVEKRGHGITPVVRSGRPDGGQHIYFKHPGFRVKNATNLGGIKGLDIRGDGGIVIVPPSKHESGNPYEWTISPYDAPPEDLPEWLLELLSEDREREPLNVKDSLAGVPEGERDQTLFRLAGKLRHLDFPLETAIRMVEEAAGECKPPFPKSKAQEKVERAYKEYGPGDSAALLVSSERRENGHRKPGESLEVFSLAKLMGEEYPPVKWAVPYLLPQGTMLFAGKPKMGKSWLALGVCISVATGGKALCEYVIHEPGDVLYLALEDQPRRLQSRARELLKSELAGEHPPTRLDLTTQSRRLNDGLVTQVEEWLDAHPAARMVVIDTLGAVKGGPKSSSDNRTLYEQDYEVGQKLTMLANAYNVCILIVHHLKKGESEDPMDLISGSTGLTGGVDGCMVLTRTRSAADGILRAFHRDVEDDPEIALVKVEASAGWWKYAGNAEEYKLSGERRQILGFLENADKPLRPMEIAEALDQNTQNVSKLLQKLREDGYVDSPAFGKYVIATGVKPAPVLRVVKDEPESEEF